MLWKKTYHQSHVLAWTMTLLHLDKILVTLILLLILQMLAMTLTTMTTIPVTTLMKHRQIETEEALKFQNLS